MSVLIRFTVGLTSNPEENPPAKRTLALQTWVLSSIVRAGKMTHQLKAGTSLAEGPSSFPSTHFKQLRVAITLAIAESARLIRLLWVPHTCICRHTHADN